MIQVFRCLMTLEYGVHYPSVVQSDLYITYSDSAIIIVAYQNNIGTAVLVCVKIILREDMYGVLRVQCPRAEQRSTARGFVKISAWRFVDNIDFFLASDFSLLPVLSSI